MGTSQRSSGIQVFGSTIKSKQSAGNIAKRPTTAKKMKNSNLLKPTGRVKDTTVNMIQE
jgi:hypothetical protein